MAIKSIGDLSGFFSSKHVASFSSASSVKRIFEKALLASFVGVGACFSVKVVKDWWTEPDRDYTLNESFNMGRYMPSRKHERLVQSYERIFLVAGLSIGGVAYFALKRRSLISTLLPGAAAGYLLKEGVFKLVISREYKREVAHARHRNEVNNSLFLKTKYPEDSNFPEPKYLEPLDDTPDEYTCPISFMIMEDPVKMPDGRHYERKAIQEYYDRGNWGHPHNRDLKMINPNPHSRENKNPVPTDETLKATIEQYIRDCRGEEAFPAETIDQEQVLRVV